MATSLRENPPPTAARSYRHCVAQPRQNTASRPKPTISFLMSADSTPHHKVSQENKKRSSLSKSDSTTNHNPRYNCFGVVPPVRHFALGGLNTPQHPLTTGGRRPQSDDGLVAHQGRRRQSDFPAKLKALNTYCHGQTETMAGDSDRRNECFSRKGLPGNEQVLDPVTARRVLVDCDVVGFNDVKNAQYSRWTDRGRPSITSWTEQHTLAATQSPEARGACISRGRAGVSNG